MKVSSNQNYNVIFNAQLISQWKCLNAKGNTKNISIISFEKRDLEFIKEFRKRLDSFNYLTPVRQAIIDASTKTIETTLESIVDVYEKIKMFVAVHDGKPCGFLVANIPKTLPVTENITYSSRHNAARNETEIDWLVTWSPNRNEKIKGIGKALVGEFFRTLKDDKFKNVFVRSEVPEFSYAAAFYESLGFKRLGKKRAQLSNKNSNPYIIEDFSNAEEQIIPMIITKGKINKLIEKTGEESLRQEFVKSSVNINNLVSLKHLHL